MKKKGQVSMEYMLVVGFALLMVIPLFAIYGKHSQETNDQVNTHQAYNIARKIVDSAETVYYLGKPAKTTIKVYMPHNIENVTVQSRAILFNIRSTEGRVIQVPPPESSINMSGSISASPGMHLIEIVADDYFVNISTVK